MILYHITTTYHLLCAMVLRQRQNEETVALCSLWLQEKFPQVDMLNGFFDKVVFADFNYRFFHSDKETERYFISLIGKPEKYSEIYVWGAQFSFGFFLDYRKIKYIYCEEAAGMISRPNVVRNIEKNDGIKKRYWNLCENYGAYDGSGKNVLKRICNVAAQEKDFKVDETIIDFSVVSELQKLPHDEREKILLFFNPPRGLHVSENATILLTQHLSNLGITSFEGQILLYQLAVDYFFENDRVVIKPHPDDLLYYSQLFPEAQIIHERFPSEFMPFIFDNQPECIATISSTAIYNLRGRFPKIFELDTRFERDYPMIHRYYVAMKIAQRLNLDVICYKSNELLAGRLSESFGENAPHISCGDTDPAQSVLLIIDDVTIEGEKGRARVLDILRKMNTSSCAVMINSQSDYCWYNYEKREIWQNIIPIVITKTVLQPQSDDFFAPVQDETVYVYSKNKELLEMAKETEIKKSLPHAGITVESARLDAQEEKIKMLEGILAATERRLLYYIEKEKKTK